MDIVGRPHTEDDGAQEDTGGEHRPNPETDRGRNAAKGFQPGTFARYASLKSASPDHARQFNPPSLRGFSLMLACFGRRHVNLLRMAGFAWHLYPETASKPHLSNEVGGAIILVSQRTECFVTEFLKITECARTRKGESRKDTGQWTLYWSPLKSGEERHSHGYRVKWQKYEDGWAAPDKVAT